MVGDGSGGRERGQTATGHQDAKRGRPVALNGRRLHRLLREGHRRSFLSQRRVPRVRPAIGGRRRRQRLQTGDGDFQAVMEHLSGTLESLQVPPALIAEVASIALSVKGDVLNR